MAGIWKPVPDHTFVWDTSTTTYRYSVVVMKKGSGNDNMVTNPSGTIANDRVVGVAQEDAGPSALGPATSAAVVDVQVFGTALCYGKGTITDGDVVGQNTAAISVTPPGYTSSVSVWPVITRSQTAGGSQPAMAVGIAATSTSADGDYVYVNLLIGMMW